MIVSLSLALSCVFHRNPNVMNLILITGLFDALIVAIIMGSVGGA